MSRAWFDALCDTPEEAEARHSYHVQEAASVRAADGMRVERGGLF